MLDLADLPAQRAEGDTQPADLPRQGQRVAASDGQGSAPSLAGVDRLIAPSTVATVKGGLEPTVPPQPFIAASSIPLPGGQG